jgi:hypothetical protein
MVALELWRGINSWNALGAGDFSLHFIKNKEQQEVDFLIANERGRNAFQKSRSNSQRNGRKSDATTFD